MDFPGHRSFRDKALAALNDARLVVCRETVLGHEKSVRNDKERQIFVVDPFGDFQQASEFLFNVLSHRTVAEARVPVLLACSKVDLPGGKRVDEIEGELLKRL